MRKIIILPTLFAIIFLLFPDLSFAPSDKAPDIQKKPELTAGQFKPPSQTNNSQEEEEKYLRRNRSGSGFKAKSSNMELMGTWPYGSCTALAFEATTYNIALAGNGEMLQIFDISDPSSPSQIGETHLQAKPCDIAFSGGFAYVVTRNTLYIVDISTPSNPDVRGTVGITGEVECSSKSESIEISLNYAYVATNQEGLRIFNISNPDSPYEVGSYDPGTWAGSWVRDVAVYGNYVLLLIMNQEGPDWKYQLRIVDVSYHSSPSLKGTYDGESYHEFTRVEVSDAGYAYISQRCDADEESKLIIIDIASDPANPTEVGSYTEWQRDFFDVKVSGNYAYLYDHWYCRLETINISDPSAPFYLSECDIPCFYENLHLSGDYVGMPHRDGFSFYNVSNPSNPFQEGIYQTPDYIGWSGNPIVVSGDYVYMAHQSGGLLIMDVSTPSSPSVASIYKNFPADRGLAVSGIYAYVLDGANLHVVDISSPSNPIEVSNIGLPWDPRDVAVWGNYAYVSGMEHSSGDNWANLSVVDISDPLNPIYVGYWVSPTPSDHHSGGIAVSGKYVYLAVDDYSYGDHRATLRIIDISDPTSPAEAGCYTASEEWSWCTDVEVRGGLAYFTGNHFRIIDVSNPESPSEISSYPYSCHGIALSGNYAYLNDYRIELVDISDSYNPFSAGYYRNDLERWIAVSGNYAYVPGTLYVLRNTLAPEVSITSPAPWAIVAGGVTIEAQASHSSGIASVEFYIDDVLYSVVDTPPYSYGWVLSPEKDAPHKIRVRAYNNDGNSSDAEIVVTVSNYRNLTISSAPGGTTDPAPSTYPYLTWTDVSVEAIPDSGYEFSGWTGDVPPGQEIDNPVTITLDDDKSITANFTVTAGNYELIINPGLGGTSSPEPGAYSYAPGAVISITSLPDTGNSFLYWSGDVPLSHEYDNPLSITLDSNKYITPHFSFGGKSWTFMVYMDGDNDLEFAGVDDFLEMADVGSDENINIVVQFDRRDGYDNKYGDWTSTKRFYVTKGMAPLPGNALQDLGELNHGDPQTLTDFVNWTKETYPAAHYALVLWNHGGGWRESKEAMRQERLKSQKELNFKAVCWDDTDGSDSLLMDEVQTALSSCGGAHLIGFDASDMGMVEVAYEIRDYGEVMVGSEEDQPGDGWPYDTILQDLASNPNWSNSEFGSAIVDRYYECYGSNYTLSAIDLNNMNTLASTISSFAQTLINNWNTDETAVKNAAQAVMTEIENTALHVQQGLVQQNAHGLTIYFPEISGEFSSEYNGTIIDFPNDTQWEEFLQAFYTSMGGSWIKHRRAGSQQFGTSQYVDIYHFCELINTKPREYYTNNQILHEYVGGGIAQDWQVEDEPLSYSLPFDFPYFEEIIPAGRTIYISPNGFVDFEYASCDRWNSASKLANNKRIAPCWTALWTNGSAQADEDIYITENPDNLVIRWVAETFDTPRPVNIELILRSNGQIQFNYDGGNAELSYQPPTIGISKGDGLHFYLSIYDRQTALVNVNSDVYTPISDSEPSVSITNPSDGATVSGTVNIQADASDDNEVTQVEFYIDDELQATDTVSPYSWDWDTRSYSNGPYTIKTIAYDNIGQTDEYQISVTADNFFLTLSTTTGGTTSPEPGTYAHANGENVSITAIAQSCYNFSGWTGDVPVGQENSNPITITMDVDKSITANFTPFAGYYELIIAAEEGGITEPVPGAYSHPDSTEVSINAVPDDDYGFNGWTGDVPGGQEMDNPITITVDTNKSITANFIVQYTLTIDPSLGGSTDPSAGEHAYNTGTEVSITATPDSGYEFSSWTGDVPPGQEMDNSVTIIMDMDKSLSANFTVEEGNRELMINIVQGDGTTTPAAGAYSYALGTEVSISASPDAGASFLYWTGDVPQSQRSANPLTVAMNRARTINAHFSYSGDYIETQIPHEFIGGGTAQNFKADDSYMTYALPFDFPYFGEIIPAGTVICVPTKGFIDFAVLTYDYSNTVSELISNKRIAIFWENLRTNGSAQADEDIYITENPDNMIIRWAAETLSFTKPVNVELVLYTDGRIQFNFNGGNDLSGISWYPTIGISKGDGVKYNLSIYNGQETFTNVESILFTPIDIDYPPSVSITSPIDWEIVGGTVNVQVSASDNIQVTKVEFYIDNELRSTDVTSPYAWSWDTTTAGNGTREIKAIAYDNLGQPSTHSISVDVFNPLLTISVTSGGTTDPRPGVSHSYNLNTDASVIAYPDSGYEFSGWSGDATGMDNPLTINMDGDKNITANFALVIGNYELTIDAGSGGTTDPIPGSYSHPADAQVEITAYPENGYAFNGWTGDVPVGQENDNPVAITMNATKSITASFIQLFALNVASERGGTTNPAPGNYTHHSGSLVSITAIPNAGYTFNGWTGDVPAGQENDNPLSLTMDNDKSLSASFVLVPGNCELTINSPIRGTTAPAPGSYSCTHGEEISVTATPDSGYQFAFWSGDVPPGHEADNPITVILDEDKSITANFRVEPGNYELIINESYGGTTVPAPGEYSYTGATEASITAIPDGGASFVRWTGDVPEENNNDNPLSLTMIADKSITPLFSFPGEYYSESQIPVVELSQGSATGSKGDDIILTYTLPFDFPFYGEYIPAGTEIFICTNGFIDFEAPFVDWTNTLEEFITHRRIAPLWKDLKTNGLAQAGEDIYITENIDNLIVRWAAETYPGGEPVNVEVILYKDGKIQFNYGDGNSISGTPPTIGLSKGDGLKYNISSYNGETTLTFYDSDIFTPTGLSDDPPYVVITSPFDGETVGGMVEIQASASDDKEVLRVEFFINGELKSRDVTAPYSYSWNTIPCADGSSPAIQVVAYDNISQTSDHELSVTIDNYYLSIGITPGGTTDPAPGVYTYGPGADVTVTAIPNTASYHIFNGWTGNVPAGQEMDNPLIITMDAENKSITATFIKNYELTINSGTGGTTDPLPGIYNYGSTTNVTVTANPDSGYEFNGWTGDVPAGQEMNNPITIIVDANKSITANFSVIPGNYELIINSATGGTTDPAPGHYFYSAGTEVSITANPDSDFSFLFWTGDIPTGHEKDNPVSITMDSNKTIVPVFVSYAWTFMVYLDGDNNLESTGIDDFLEMASVGSNSAINIVVQFDRISGYSTSYGDWTTTKRFHITSGMTPTADNALEDLGELNHGDPQTLIDFIDWAKTNYPAEKYALILWNHGGGWREFKEIGEQAKLEGKDRPYYRAVCWDDTDGGDTLYMDEVQGALDVTGSHHLIGFDACLMGMVEVAYEIKDYGEVMVGSEETEPGDGWPYDMILQDLVNNPGWSSSEFGQAIVDRYYESYGYDETQSAIDMTALDSLAGSISTFAQSLMDNWNTDVAAVKNVASEIMTAIGNAVIHEQHGSSWPGAYGLAVYFPLTSGEFDSDYESVVDFTNDTQWDEFLQEFYNSMAGSWVFQRRAIAQQFVYPEHVDLYHFCELLNTDTEDYYTRFETSHEYLGGGTAWDFRYDEASMTYNLPFDFPFFGEIIPEGTIIYVCSNGYIDFNDFNIDYSNSGQELANNKRIAPYWVDLKTDGSAQSGEDVYITENADSLVIRWVAQTYSGAVPVNVELILYADGRIQFNYDGGNDLSATAYSPTIGISKGDGINCYFAVHNGQKVLTDVDSAVFTPWIIEPPSPPENPSPAHEATDVSVETDFNWDDCPRATSYDVYFGGSSPAPYVETTIESYYDPGILDYSTTYYWKIVAKNDCGDTHGEEWSFTTGGIQQYSLTLTAEEGGTTDPAPGTYMYDSGTGVSITAIPGDGYRFSGWSGDVPSGHENDNPLTLTMDSDKSITANFVRQHTLTIVAGEGGTTDPAPGTYTYDSGTEVTVEATPNSGYQFSGWSGDVSSTDNPITLTIESDKSITASFFLIPQYTLTIAAGSGGTTDPVPGSHIYNDGTIVTITATADTGYRFAGWTGDVPDGHESDNPLTLTMDSNKSVTAHFIRQYALTIASGSGGTTDPAPETYTYDSGTEVTIEAIPDTGYRFAEWTGDVPEGHEGDNPIVITMDSDKSLTANFIRQYTLTIAAGTGGITDPIPGSYLYDQGTEVTITAQPESDYEFSHWKGDVPEGHEEDNPLTLTMDSDKSIAANFVRQYTLTIMAGEGGTTDPSPDTYTYDSGTKVSFTAIPGDGYRFSGWTGEFPSGHENDNPITLTMDSDKSLTANFIRQFTLTIAAGSGGTTNPSPGSYAHDAGTNVSVTAIPNSGYHFSGWSGDASGTTETITITMDSNKSITASFASDSPGGGGGGDDGGDGGGGGCFIATAAYGSPLHPHIDILRDFRDRYLMTNALGRKFVAMYYKYSPFVAERIAKYKILKVVVRIQLLPLVALSYSTVYFGPIMTAFVFVFIFMLPVFLFPYSRKKCRGTKT